jgi:hypothetical protein
LWHLSQNQKFKHYPLNHQEQIAQRAIERPNDCVAKGGRPLHVFLQWNAAQAARVVRRLAVRRVDFARFRQSLKSNASTSVFELHRLFKTFFIDVGSAAYAETAFFVAGLFVV